MNNYAYHVSSAEMCRTNQDKGKHVVKYVDDENALRKFREGMK